MIAILEFVFTCFVIFVLSYLWRLYRRAAHPPDRTIPETIAFLRPLNLEDLEELLDHTAEAYLELNLSPRQFKGIQKGRSARFLEHLGRMIHNSHYLTDWARRQRLAAKSNNDSELEALCTELVRACIEIDGGVRNIQVAILGWRLKNAIFPFAKALHLVPLASFGPFELVAAYKRMADIALTLCYAIEPELEEELTLAL